MSHLPKAEKNQEFLEEHDRLANLYVTNRFAFEKERKRIINETINNMSCREELKEKLRAQQKDWERILRGTGSAENRFAMIQALFWHQVVNNFQPALQTCVATLHPLKNSRRRQSALTLIKK